MRKVLFIPTGNAGVVWQRMMLYFRYLQSDPRFSMAMDKFYPDSLNPYPWQLPENHSKMFLAQLEKIVSQADAVVMQYVVTDYAFCIVRGLKELFPKKPILTEIDDYCFEINHYSPAAVHYKPGNPAPQAIRDMMSLTDGVIVSTPYLKKLYSEFNENIHVIENGIDFKVWDAVVPPKPKKRPLRIGWCGAATHDEDLRFIEKVVYQVLEKYPQVEFFFKGGAPGFLIKKHERITCLNNWANPYHYPQALADEHFDIGLAPLLDNNFNRAKSNLRWLEYSALKIPTIASTMGEFKRTVKDGVTGLLCTERQDWFNAIAKLIEDETLRKWIGHNAYESVKADFNIEKISRRYGDILEGLNEHDAIRSEKQGALISA